jgi:tetratricopeptide (TPR) repeat protein
MMMACALALAQKVNPPSPADDLQAHFASAHRSQVEGRPEQAIAEYKLFLAAALRRLAERATAGEDHARAAAMLGEAAELTPQDIALSLDYVQALRGAGRLPQAQAEAESIARSNPKDARPHLALARILSQTGKKSEAAQQLELAVAAEPSFENGLQLAAAYLALKDPARATRIFSEMLASYGETAEIHMQFGKTCADAGDAELAAGEFRQAIAKDPQLAGAHYSLGAAYVLGVGEAAYPQAESEFREELKYHPDDFLNLLHLGNIALARRKLDEAEDFLARAAHLAPHRPDIYLALGETYVAQERPAAAQAPLRKAIALTTDVSANNYQVQRAHYLLGKVLMQLNRPEEGKRELETAAQLLKQSVAANQGISNSESSGPASETRVTAPVAPSSASPPKPPDEFESQISAAIADSYNNLGAMAAERQDFSTALPYFRLAAQWNPGLEELQSNWGRAAFSAKAYAEAVPPLGSYLQVHPADNWFRAALAWSQYQLVRYADVVQTLRPMENQLHSVPRLNLIYAVSLSRSGESQSGLQRLQAMAASTPNSAEVHHALGEALAAQEQKEQAAAELLTAGKLQLQSGDAKAAIASLEQAVKIKPGDDAIRRELAAAHKQASLMDTPGKKD